MTLLRASSSSLGHSGPSKCNSDQLLGRVNGTRILARVIVPSCGGRKHNKNGLPRKDIPCAK
eukprot:138469-Chlamydomonas_euryale.AAC.1